MLAKITKEVKIIGIKTETGYRKITAKQIVRTKVIKDK